MQIPDFRCYATLKLHVLKTEVRFYPNIFLASVEPLIRKKKLECHFFWLIPQFSKKRLTRQVLSS